MACYHDEKSKNKLRLQAFVALTVNQWKEFEQTAVDAPLVRCDATPHGCHMTNRDYLEGESIFSVGCETRLHCYFRESGMRMAMLEFLHGFENAPENERKLYTELLNNSDRWHEYEEKLTEASIRHEEQARTAVIIN